MAKYRNKGGPHQAADGTSIKAGEVFESDELLHKGAFADKFELMINEPEPAPAPPAAPAEEEPAEEEAKTTAGRKDVTEDFTIAVEADLQVLKDKKGWWIFDEGDEPINEKPLRKKDVEEAIEAYLAD